MLKDFFLNEVKSAIKKAVENGKLGQMGLNDDFSLIIEKSEEATPFLKILHKTLT